MWGIIATWRMAVEGISEASHILQEKGDAGDAIETAIKAVEDFPYYKSVGYGGLPNEEMETGVGPCAGAGHGPVSGGPAVLCGG